MRYTLTKRASLTLLLILSVLALLASSQNWLTFTLDTVASSNQSLSVAGNAVAPLAFSLSIIALAGVGALTIADRVVSVIILVAVSAASIGIVAVTWAVMNDPVGYAKAQLSAATGLAGLNTLRDHVIQTELSPWVIVTLIVAIVVAATSIATLFFVRNWTAGGTRYSSRAVRGAAEDHADSTAETFARFEALSDDRIQDWDALSQGEDPSKNDPS